MSSGELLAQASTVIRTPDQRLRVFVSSTLGELADERQAARRAIERLYLSPVMFELGARPHPPRELYRAYLAQSHVFIGIYWQRYGWVAPGETVSGLEDEYLLAGDRPRLIYIKEPSPDREPRLVDLLTRIRDDDRASYKRFSGAHELTDLIANDLAVLLAERFDAGPSDVPEPAMSHSAPPVPLTETVGRAKEIEAVAQMLKGGARLVTLTGPGGIGKSRLALEVARRERDANPGGVHFVPLAPISDPDLVIHAIADRLGIPIEGTRHPLAAIADRIAGKRTLILLDNLEQIPTVGGELSSLLQSCPDLFILATSRQALRVRAEHDVSVAPLPLPDPKAPRSLLEDQPAVRLFVERARSVSAGFALGEHNIAAIAELCRRLDGLPLAIELAAARIRLLSPAALLARLNERMDALGVGGADAPERQRTLRATMDWSYDLLDEAERALFARLSVFTGGFSLDDAEAVCGGGDGVAVIETLASLLDKSLLVVSDDPIVGEPRFHMLETVRAYAREHLERHGETSLLRRRHLEWYRELSDRAQPFLCGPGQREWAARFDHERANLRAAIDTALELEDDHAVIELVWDVIVFYFIRDAMHEPETWLERVAAAGRPLTEVMEAKLNSLLALLRILGGHYEGAREALESSLAVFEARGMDFEAAVTLKELAWVRYLLDEDTPAAVSSLEEAVRLFDGVAHDWGVALTELQLGSVLTASADLEGAEAHLRRSLERSRRIDNWPLIAQGLQDLGMIRVLAGHHADAVPLLEEAAALLRQGRHRVETTLCLHGLGAVSLARGDAHTAARAVAVAETARAELGVTPWPSVQGFVSELTEAVRHRIGPDAFEALCSQAEDADLFDILDQTLETVRALAP